MKASKVLIVSLFIFTSLLISNNYLATATEVESEANVRFVPNAKPVEPVEPGEGKPIEPNRPPTEGPLSLNYASNVQFGSQKKTQSDQIFYAQLDDLVLSETGEKLKVANFVQITDLRGTAAGWTLSVRQNGPLTKANGAQLTGAQLTIFPQSVESMYGFKEAPSGLKKKQSLLEDGQAHEILRAEPGTGVSTWNVILGKNDDLTSGISLKVPKEGVPEVGRYTTTLTWVLSDGL